MPAHPPTHALYTVPQLRVVEAAARTALGVTDHELMARAANAALHSLRRHWPQARKICIHCGPGNNGGDGFLLAVLAQQAGLQVDLVAVGESSHGEAAAARKSWEGAGGRIQRWDEGDEIAEVELHVDALYGIGLNRAPEPALASLIRQINRSGCPVLALDVPTGLNADTGDCPGAAVCADVTVTFIARKRGLHTGRAADHVGELELSTLGVPESIFSATPGDAHLLTADTLASRPRYANKGSNGHVLVIGGEHGTAGAARLTAEAALRVGAGLVSVATHDDNVFAINATRPEIMARGIDGPQTLAPMIERASVLAVGPGLGKAAWGHALWLTALDAAKPLVLDADGLNLLARDPRQFSAATILTPHPGEAARLLETSVSEVENNRFAAVRELARRYQAVVVLKGSGSLLAAPGGRLAVCPWGNPGMASGGMGDLLTGVIAGLLAQGCDAWRAACLGVGLHARAGDRAAQHGERGLLASDLLLPLRRLTNGLSNDEYPHE